jgi:hypothetical protein
MRESSRALFGFTSVSAFPGTDDEIDEADE